MRSLRSFHLILVLAVGTLAVPLFQQSDDGFPQARFDILDYNRDGYISAGELDGRVASRRSFQHADHDRDGQLNSLEFQAALDAPPAQR